MTRRGRVTVPELQSMFSMRPACVLADNMGRIAQGLPGRGSPVIYYRRRDRSLVFWPQHKTPPDHAPTVGPVQLISSINYRKC